MTNPSVIIDRSNPEHRKQLRSTPQEAVARMDAGDRLVLYDFLRGGKLPALAALSRLCRAGLVRMTPNGYDSSEGVRGALAEYRQKQREGN